MAGNANPNRAVALKDTANRRTGEVSGADWTGGMNDAGACAPGIGINTGDYSPKPSDWSEDERIQQASQQIGQSVVVLNPQGLTGDEKASFIQADGVTAPDAELDVATGAVNRTGKTVPAGAWVWGEEPA